MKSHEKHLQSVVAEVKLLKDIIRSPNVFIDTKELINAMKTQSGFAKYHDNQRGIVSYSLNTQKACAEEVIDDGFSGLNILRNNALQAITNKKVTPRNSNRSTIAGLNNTVKELEVVVETLKKRNHLLTSIIASLQDDLHNFAAESGKPELESRAKERLKVAFAKLSYAQHGVK